MINRYKKINYFLLFEKNIYYLFANGIFEFLKNVRNKMKPIIKYRGGKSKEIPQILPYIPKFTGKYIEPFFGGGALFFYLEPTNAIINDINKNLIDFYKDIKNNYTKIKKELFVLERTYKKNRENFDKLKSEYSNERVNDLNEDLYYKIRDIYNGICNENSFSYGTLYYFINKTSYSGMIRYNIKGHFNVPYGRYKNFNTSLLTEEHYKLLKNTKIFNYSYEKIFEMAKEEDFIFLDPPYDCVFSDYGNEEMKEGFGEARHRKLAEDFRNLKCKALMVIGKTPLTEELYNDLIIAEYEKSYAVNIRNRFKSESKHILVANYGGNDGKFK